MIVNNRLRTYRRAENTAGWKRLPGASGQLPQYEGRVLRAEGDAVANCIFDFGTSPRFGHVIEIAIIVGFFQVYRWRNLAVPHSNQRGGNSGGATGSLRMPDLRLQAGHRRLARLLAQGQLQRARLDAVVQLRRGAVQVDVADVCRCDACIFHGHLNGAGRLLSALLQANAMKGLAGRAISRYLGEDPRSSRAGMLVLLEEEHPRTFGHNEAVAMRIRVKPFMIPGAIGASTPPTSIMGRKPNWICRSA